MIMMAKKTETILMKMRKKNQPLQDFKKKLKEDATDMVILGIEKMFVQN